MTLARHPWNQSFQWTPVTGPFRRVSGERARAFNELGYFRLDDAFDADTIAAVRAEIDPIEERVAAFLRTQPDERMFIAAAPTITFSVHLVTMSRRLRAFCADPVFCDLAHDLIGPDVRLYWDQAVYKKFEQPRPFPWHQDNGYTYVEPQQYLTCWVALTDADEDNGCPWVVPRLHHMGTLKHWSTELGFQCLDEPADAVPVPAKAGSIVVFSSLTPHCTGPNRTDRVRRTYIVQFAPDGARALSGDPTSAAPPVSELQNHPERQYLILRHGEAVAVP